MIQHYHICMFWPHDDSAQGNAYATFLWADNDKCDYDDYIEKHRNKKATDWINLSMFFFKYVNLSPVQFVPLRAIRLWTTEESSGETSVISMMLNPTSFRGCSVISVFVYAKQSNSMKLRQLGKEDT